MTDGRHASTYFLPDCRRCGVAQAMLGSDICPGCAVETRRRNAYRRPTRAAGPDPWDICPDCRHPLEHHDEPGDTEAAGSCRDCAAAGMICDRLTCGACGQPAGDHAAAYCAEIDPDAEDREAFARDLERAYLDALERRADRAAEARAGGWWLLRFGMRRVTRGDWLRVGWDFGAPRRAYRDGWIFTTGAPYATDRARSTLDGWRLVGTADRADLDPHMVHPAYIRAGLAVVDTHARLCPDAPGCDCLPADAQALALRHEEPNR